MKADLLFTYLLSLLLPSVLVSFAANSVVFALLVLISVLRLKTNYDASFFRKYLWFSAFIMSILLAVFLDFGHHYGFDSRQLTKRLAFILMPFIIYHASNDDQRNALKVLVYFMSILSALLMCIGLIKSWINKDKVLYGNWDSETTEAFYTNDMLLNWGELSYKRIFLFLDIHPTYYAFFSLVVLLILLFTSVIKISKWQELALVLIHITMILLISSKAGILSLLVIIGFKFYDRKNLKKTVFGVLSFSVIVLIALSIPSTKLRIQKTYESIVLSENSQNLSGSDGRLQLWNSLGEFETGELLFGIGIQGSRDKVYQITGEDKNMHNQFLQALVSSGIAGFFLLISFLALPLFYSRNSFTYAFAASLFLNLFLENMLDRVWGIMPVAFFYSLFVFGDQEVLTKNMNINSK